MANPFEPGDAIERTDEENERLAEHLDMLRELYDEAEALKPSEARERALHHLHAAGLFLNECDYSRADAEEKKAEEAIDDAA